MKKLLIAFLIIIVLLVAAAMGVLMYLDSAAKIAVEKGGTYATGVPTTLRSADVKPLAGEFAMTGLNVANPDGYDSKHFMTLGNGDVAVSLGTLLKDVVHLPHLNLSDVDMNLEKKDGKANYQTIIDNLKKLSPEKPDPNAKKFVIESVTIRKINVRVNMLGQSVDVPIDSITLKNVGSDGVGGAGVDLGQLTGVLTKSIFEAVVKSGAGAIPAELLGDLTKGLGDLANLDKLGEIADIGGEIAGKAGEVIGEAGDAAKKAADDIANKAKEGLGGILGGDKKKDGGN